MHLTYCLLISFFAMNTLTIFNFNTHSNISNWVVIDDVVMGGASNGTFKLNNNGNGVFEGNISLENNGGFSSLRYQTKTIDVSRFKKIKLRIKGDGKKYQFRVKSNKYYKYAFTTYFQTSFEWQTIEIFLSDLEPTFRGRKLIMPNFSEDQIEEIGFLFGNKKNESFKLIFDTIEIE